MTEMSAFETNELIIREVQKRNVIWDKRNTLFYDKYVVAQAFQEVAEITGTSEKEVKIKWGNLRDQFKKELKEEKSGSSKGKWLYYTLMLFLKDAETPQNASGTFLYGNDLKLKQSDVVRSPSIENPRTTFDGVNSPSLQSATQDNQTLSQSVDKSVSITEQTDTKLKDQKKKKTRENDPNFEQHMVALKKAKIEAFVNSSKVHTKDDEDMLFLKSIHPYFTAMSPLKKLRVRNQIHEILIKELPSVPPSQSTNDR